MVYKEKIKMDKKEYDFYNKLLSLDLEEMCEDELEKEKARKDDFISLFCIEFKNKNYITYDLISGNSNYFDNIVLFDENGNELSCSDCNFEIGGFELFYDNDIYQVEIEVI